MTLTIEQYESAADRANTMFLSGGVSLTRREREVLETVSYRCVLRDGKTRRQATIRLKQWEGGALVDEDGDYSWPPIVWERAGAALGVDPSQCRRIIR